jgi:hypothetical protein
MERGDRARWLLPARRLLAVLALLPAATAAADPPQPGTGSGPGRIAAGGLLKVVGGVMIGPKERLVVVEVGQTWLIVGVGAASVSLVHSMPRPEGAAPAPEQSFSRLIGQALRSRNPEG